MKIIIAGSRTITNYKAILCAIKNSGFNITEVVSGGAKGVDSIGENWAIANKIPFKRFLANWTKYGRKAGYLRNRVMVEYADGLIAVWDNQSRGTKNMIDEIEALNKPFHVHLVY